MSQHIALILGHPDPSRTRYGHALARAYAEAAAEAGHEVCIIDVAQLDVPLVRTQEEWRNGALPEPLRRAQQDIFAADHLAIFFPLWLGTMPALLKAFFEQILRIDSPDLKASTDGGMPRPLKGKSARVVVTMGMPALVFRGFFFSHGLKCLTRNILGFCGAGPVSSSVIGSVEGSPRARQRWLAAMTRLGRAAR